jgi:hypothetical protein
VAITDESNRSNNTYIESSQTSRSEKTITLNINGSGSIQLDRNADKEQVWDDVKDVIKENLMDILAEEMLTGSDQVYDY